MFRADTNVLTLPEQAILVISGASIRARLLPNGWRSSPPPDQARAIARWAGLAQLLPGGKPHCQKMQTNRRATTN